MSNWNGGSRSGPPTWPRSTGSLRAKSPSAARPNSNCASTQSDLVQAGKLAALGQMSAALSHEFNQPLAAVKTLCRKRRHADRAQAVGRGARQFLAHRPPRRSHGVDQPASAQFRTGAEPVAGAGAALGDAAGHVGNRDAAAQIRGCERGRADRASEPRPLSRARFGCSRCWST